MSYTFKPLPLTAKEKKEKKDSKKIPKELRLEKQKTI